MDKLMKNDERKQNLRALETTFLDGLKPIARLTLVIDCGKCFFLL